MNIKPKGLRTPLDLIFGAVFLAISAIAINTASSQVIFRKDSSKSFLFSDKRALKKGDLLTVVISERVIASQSANTKMNREDQNNLSPGIGLLGFLSGWGLASQEEFKGFGSTNRQGSMVGTLTVEIVDVLENGTYRIEGKQEIVVNREKQILKLSGIVRPVDVGPNNTVSSTKVGQAKIEFVSEGLTQRKQKRPWLFRLLDHIF